MHGKTPTKRIAALLFLGTLTAFTAGCGPQMVEWGEKKEEPKIFAIAGTQTAGEPVYSRMRYVYAPSPLPSESMPQSTGQEIFPVFHMELKNTRLEEAARVLAATARYSSYCASSIADQKISINRLGTIEELAAEVARQSGIHAVVDHGARQVRFMAGSQGSSPRFTEDGDTGDS